MDDRGPKPVNDRSILGGAIIAMALHHALAAVGRENRRIRSEEVESAVARLRSRLYRARIQAVCVSPLSSPPQPVFAASLGRILRFTLDGAEHDDDSTAGCARRQF